MIKNQTTTFLLGFKPSWKTPHTYISYIYYAQKNVSVSNHSLTFMCVINYRHITMSNNIKNQRPFIRIPVNFVPTFHDVRLLTDETWSSLQVYKREK